MDALTKSYDRSEAVVATAEAMALQLKQAGIADSLVSPAMQLPGGDWMAQLQGRENLSLMRSWVYSAVNALSSEAASQPVSVGKGAPIKTEARTFDRVKSVIPKEDRLAATKSALRKLRLLDTMPKCMKHKAAGLDVELLPNHELAQILERPNPIQYRFQFVYTFVANLNLTGRAYIVMDEEDGKVVFYALPSTWIRPDHTNGPFSKFYVCNPRTMDYQKAEPLDASQVVMAYLPNPADPMGSLSPATAMRAAIDVDDKIQTCQTRFFENGVFPSMVVTIGKDPHPDVPGGMRPRLTANQRRQVIGAIRRTMGSVANYGVPAIVDGLIESVQRLSATQDEIGWERSEDKIKMRILSAFCVHPFILGEPVGVGGYAQTYNIHERFATRVNVFLDLLSTVMTHLISHSKAASAKDFDRGSERLLVWWEALRPSDPSMEWQNRRFARQNNDVSRNEFRSWLGLASDEDKPEPTIPVALAQTVMMTAQAATQGTLQVEQAKALLDSLGLPSDVVEAIAGTGPPTATGAMPGGLEGLPLLPQDQGNLAGQGDQAAAPTDEGQTLDEATAALRGAVAAMRAPLNVGAVVDAIVSEVSGVKGSD